MRPRKGQLVLVRCGASNQVAEVLASVGKGLVQVRKWQHSSKRWTKPAEIPLGDVQGAAPVKDERRIAAAAAIAEARARAA